MAVVGRNSNRLDARYTVVAGAALYMLSMWQMSLATSVSGADDFFWPLIWRGVGLGLIFVPLTNATIADLSPKDLAQGTGMFNLFRQLGGSLGIAIMTTLLSHVTQVQQTYVTEHVAAGSPETMSRLALITKGLIAQGINPTLAPDAAAKILHGQIQLQASMLAFSKMYLLSGIILVASLPLLLLFRTGKAIGHGAVDVH
jgi:DHA2 family multidrug resistance protein